MCCNVSLRILFADDSVTAQNMGRKILTEAGYEVVAVSNGAAAVKKIAEQKPDIIILDVYMPGYSGLEVCEKVRGSLETLKTPVLLTVGKMEPYRPEEANRVKADGVIVKPFEASDLLAIVKKFEERIGQAPVEQPVLVERFREEIPELPVEHPASSTSQPTVEVPDHMATTSAFSDLLGAEPSVSVNHFAAGPAPAAHETPAARAATRGPVPDYELPVSWRREDQENLDAEIPVAAAEAPKAAAVEPAPEPEVISPPLASRPRHLPVYQEREDAAGTYEVMPTSVPPTGEIEIPREPELQETAAEATRKTIADSIEPGLMTTRHEFERETSAAEMEAAELAPVEGHFTPAGFQDIPADIASHLPPPAVMEAAPNPASPKEASLAGPPTDADFEARVAAAMAGYNHAQDAAPSLSQAPVAGPASTSGDSYGPPAFAPTTAAEDIETGAGQPAPAFEHYPPVSLAPEAPASEPPDVVPAAAPVETDVAASAPVFEYRPPVRPMSGVVPAAAAPAVEAVPTAKTPVRTQPAPSEPPAAPRLATRDNRDARAASIEAVLPAVAAAAETGADHHTIAQAVHRVMERLKPELVEEILRELNSKK